MSQLNLKPVAFTAELEDLILFKKATLQLQKSSLNMEDSGISNLQFYTQKILGKDIVLATMDIPLEIEPAKLWEEIQTEFSAYFDGINASIAPDNHHADDGSETPWTLTETICKIRPTNAAKTKTDSPWHAAATELIKEKEAEYRLLHNNVWPGVIDAIGTSNISRFDIFLIELTANQPYLFYRLQHTGDDFDKDMEEQSKSPINQRWWKLTDTCQRPLPEAQKGPWLGMVEL